MKIKFICVIVLLLFSGAVGLCSSQSAVVRYSHTGDAWIKAFSQDTGYSETAITPRTGNPPNSSPSGQCVWFVKAIRPDLQLTSFMKVSKEQLKEGKKEGDACDFWPYFMNYEKEDNGSPNLWYNPKRPIWFGDERMPKRGAIACFSAGSTNGYSGHVAIVTEINGDGTIYVWDSNSDGHGNVRKHLVRYMDSPEEKRDPLLQGFLYGANSDIPPILGMGTAKGTTTAPPNPSSPLLGEWSGEYHQYSYGVNDTYPMTINITSVSGHDLIGTHHWPTLGDSRTTLKGTVDGSALVWTEPELIAGQNLILNGTYKATLSNDDSISGKWYPPDSYEEGGAFTLTKVSKAADPAVNSSKGYDDWWPQVTFTEGFESLVGPGRGLVFMSNRSGKNAIYLYDREKNRLQKLIDVSDDKSPWFAVSSAGNIILMDAAGHIEIFFKIDSRTSTKIYDAKWVRCKTDLKADIKFLPTWDDSGTFHFVDSGGRVKIVRAAPPDSVTNPGQADKNAGLIGTMRALRVIKVTPRAEVKISDPDPDSSYLTSTSENGHSQLSLISAGCTVEKRLTGITYEASEASIGRTGWLQMLGTSGPVVFTGMTSHGSDIYVGALADGKFSGVQRLTHDGHNSQPCWAYYTKKIYFVRDQGSKRIWEMDKDGGNAHELILQ